MTQKVCFEFCRTIPNMGFFGIVNGHGCFRFSSTKFCVVALAVSIALSAVACHGLEVRCAIAATAVDNAEEAHVWDGAAELKAHLLCHVNAVFLCHEGFVVHNGHVGHGSKLVIMLVVTKLVTSLVHVVPHTICQRKSILQDLLKRLELLDTSTWDIVILEE